MCILEPEKVIFISAKGGGKKDGADGTTWRLTGKGNINFTDGSIHMGVWGDRGHHIWGLVGVGSIAFTNGILATGTWANRGDGTWVLRGRGTFRLQDGTVLRGNWQADGSFTPAP